MLFEGFPGGSVVKNLPANGGDAGLISGCGRSPGEATTVRSLHTRTREEPLLSITRESPCAVTKTQHSQKYINNTVDKTKSEQVTNL